MHTCICRHHRYWLWLLRYLYINTILEFMHWDWSRDCMAILATLRMRNTITQSWDHREHMGILAIAHVHNFGWPGIILRQDRGSLAGSNLRAILCRAFITAKLGTMRLYTSLPSSGTRRCAMKRLWSASPPSSRMWRFGRRALNVIVICVTVKCGTIHDYYSYSGSVTNSLPSNALDSCSDVLCSQ